MHFVSCLGWPGGSRRCVTRSYLDPTTPKSRADYSAGGMSSKGTPSGPDAQQEDS